MLLRTLGGLSLEGCRLTRPQPLLLLAYLALEGPQERRRLAELFWPRASDRMKSLGVALARIRKEAGSVLVPSGRRIGTSLTVDAAQLIEALDRGDLAAASAVYRGPLFDGVYLPNWSTELEEWVLEKREAVAGRLREAMILEAEQEAGRGRFDRAGAHAEAALSLPGTAAPTVEELERLYRLLLAAGSARAADAGRELASYGAEATFTAAEARSALAAAPGRPDSVPIRLPPPRRLFGREESLEHLRRLLDLDECRLLTLLGPAGVGKTQLSLQLAHLAVSSGNFPDGAYFVPLAPVRESESIASCIVQALELPESPVATPLASLTSELARKRSLLVLDNFEQVVEGAGVVGELLTACPGVKVVVTSRVPLRLSFEQLFPLPTLALPERGRELAPAEALAFAAIELFTLRAQAVDPGFRLDHQNVEAVVEICRKLDGLPLALELAAARVNLFGPRAMLTRLERRLDLLTGGMRDAPERHRTLRNALDWSYELLGDLEKSFFRRLAVFRGGCDIAGVGAVTGVSDPAPALAVLLENSLLTVAQGAPAEPRFAMLESVREYALERLVEADELEGARSLHGRYFLELAELAASHLTGPEQRAWMDRLELEHDNLRAVLEWARESGESETGYRLAAALWRFWIARGHLLEGRQALEALHDTLRDVDGDSQEVLAARARSLHGLGTLMHEIGSWEEARPPLAESLDLWRRLGEESGVATALNSLGWVSCILGDFEAARELSGEAMKLHRNSGHRRGVALALNNLGWAAMFQSDFERARELQAEGLGLRAAVRDRRGVAYTKANLGWVLRNQGNYAEAASHLDEALVILRALNDDQLSAWALLHRGQTHLDLGELEQARSALEESESLWRAVGNRTGLCWTLIVLGYALRRSGELAAARGPAADGKEMAEAIAHRWGTALGWCGLGWLAWAEGRKGAAERALASSLVGRLALGDGTGVAECLELAAELAASAGRWEEAACYLAASESQRQRFRAPLAPSDRPRQERLLERLRAELADGFEAVWGSGGGVEPGRLAAEWLESNRG